jgi:riboflavin kinase / FMN adenylyltransferase
MRMQIKRGYSSGRPSAAGLVVAIGNFDGVHLGHQALVAAARRVAEPHQAVGVLTFEPHPREVFDPTGAPKRLMRVTDKAIALARLGVDELIVLNFDTALCQMDPDHFAREVLARALGVSHVVVGEGFRYGARRLGDVATLHASGLAHGFSVTEVASVERLGVRVSSTGVRAAVAAADLAMAETLLGRPYSLAGRVGHGQRLGRELGFPTANLRLHPRAGVRNGIYAVQVRGVPGFCGTLPAVASLGTRPTVGGVEPLLEVHLFDFSGNLYGHRIEVEFIAWLRDEERFDSLPALVAQMHADAHRAREILAARAA